jgi:hypothetical protein
MKSQGRKSAIESKRRRKEHAMSHPGARSRYAKKKAYLHRYGGWGWEYPEPKPWKG